MRKKDIKRSYGSPITVNWVDACERSGWLSPKEAMVVPDEVYVTTRGFYLIHDEKFLTLAASIGKTKENDGGRYLERRTNTFTSGLTPLWDTYRQQKTGVTQMVVTTENSGPEKSQSCIILSGRTLCTFTHSSGQPC